MVYRHRACDEISGVDLRCTHCGEPMHANDVEALDGPGSAARSSEGVASEQGR